MEKTPEQVLQHEEECPCSILKLMKKIPPFPKKSFGMHVHWEYYKKVNFVEVLREKIPKLQGIIVHSIYYHLRELRRVRRYLNHETAVNVANALVSSRLDYCNSLLYNTKKAYTSRLQRVQNALCRTVCKLNKYCHVTPFLHKLHWLPIHYRILFKYNLLIYKAIHLSQPPY